MQIKNPTQRVPHVREVIHIYMDATIINGIMLFI